MLFSNIEDDLKCSNGTTLDPPYLPYPPIDGQNEINIAEVNCKDYENSIPSDFKAYGFLPDSDLCKRGVSRIMKNNLALVQCHWSPVTGCKFEPDWMT